jgi:hypothetical protein
MLRCVALVRTDVSEERSASFIRVTRIGELGATLAVTSNWNPFQTHSFSENLVALGIKCWASESVAWNTANATTVAVTSEDY